MANTKFDVSKMTEREESYYDYLSELNARCRALSYYSRNLNFLALKGELTPTYNREAEVEQLKTILCRRTKPNPLLTGIAGCGKTAIVEALATGYTKEHLATGNSVPVIYELSLNSLISGARYRGDFEERLNNIIEILQTNSNIILFIDEIHCLCSAGEAEGAISGAQALKPQLARGSIRVIGATTTAEYEQSIAKDKALARRFSTIKVAPLTGSAKESCMKNILHEYGEYFDIDVSKVSVDTLSNIVDNMIPHTTFPDNVVDIIDETLAIAKHKQRTAITDKDIKETASRQHNIFII